MTVLRPRQNDLLADCLTSSHCQTLHFLNALPPHLGTPITGHMFGGHLRGCFSAVSVESETNSSHVRRAESGPILTPLTPQPDVRLGCEGHIVGACWKQAEGCVTFEASHDLPLAPALRGAFGHVVLGSLARGHADQDKPDTWHGWRCDRRLC